MLVDAEDGQLVAIATVNMVDFECKDDEVFIKDYSENDGIMVQILINHGVILAQHVQEITTPYVTIRSYELNPAIIDEIWKN